MMETPVLTAAFEETVSGDGQKMMLLCELKKNRTFLLENMEAAPAILARPRFSQHPKLHDVVVGSTVLRYGRAPEAPCESWMMVVVGCTQAPDREEELQPDVHTLPPAVRGRNLQTLRRQLGQSPNVACE